MSADPSKPYWYLAGPMTWFPQHNFPRFNEVADKLRGRGLNIISPAELDDPDQTAAAMASETGVLNAEMPYDADYDSFLSRDVMIVAHKNCQGVICLEGWEKSRGANIETFVADRLGRTIKQFDELPSGGINLVPIQRDAWLQDYAETRDAQQAVDEFLTLSVVNDAREPEDAVVLVKPVRRAIRKLRRK